MWRPKESTTYHHNLFLLPDQRISPRQPIVPALVVPNRSKPLNIPILESRVPKPEELVVISKPLLEATIRIGNLLNDCSAKWSLGGDIGEILNGVNVQPDHITILTNAEGSPDLDNKLEKFQ